MAATGEILPGGGPTAVDVWRAEVVAPATTDEDIKNELKNAIEKANDIKQLINTSLSGYNRNIPQEFEGDINSETSFKRKAFDVRKAVVKALIATENPAKIPTASGPDILPATTAFSRIILEKLRHHITPNSVSEQTAPYLFQIIQKTVNGGIENLEGLTQEFNSIKEHLRSISRATFENVQNALIDVAQAQGKTPEEAKSIFGATQEAQIRDETGREGESAFESDWSQYYKNFNFDVVEDKPVLEALYVPEKFIKLVDSTSKQLGRDINIENEKDLMDLSDQVAKRVISTLGKLYNRLDVDQPKKTFDELVQQDPFRGIGVTSVNIKNHLRNLQNYFSDRPDRAGKYKKLFRKSEQSLDLDVVQTKTIFKDKDGNEIISEKPKFRLNPLLKPEAVDMAGFVRYLSVQVDNFAAIREYLHNGRAIYFRQPDPQKGFYTNLGEYAEQMGTVDIDEISQLPDAPMILQAYQLYDKFLEEEFARNDWKNPTTLFENKIGDFSSRLEEQVTDALYDLYRGEPNLKSRIETARNMAIGYARAVLLTDPEKTAYADPNLNVMGGATAASYGVNDPPYLMPFNPLHLGLRWQNQNNLHRLLFMPVEWKGKPDKRHDHNDMMKRMEQLRESFVSGRRAGLEDKTLLIDYLVNVGQIGGPIKRAGWRFQFGAEGHYVYKGEGKTQELNYKETWKALEKIGYEALADFVKNQKFRPDTTTHEEPIIRSSFLKESSQEREQFFTYLYDRYFGHSGVTEDSLKDIMDGLRTSERDNLIKQIKTGAASPNNITDEAEVRAHRKFLYMTLSRIVAQRMPTKFARMDRDRFQADGESRWKKLLKNVVFTEGAAIGAADEGSDNEEKKWKAFDRAIKDLGIAESMLRAEASEDIRNKLKNLGPLDLKLHKVGDFDYWLTEDKVKEYLGEKLRDKLLRNEDNVGEYDPNREAKLAVAQKRIDRAVTVFRALRNKTRGVEKAESIITKEFLNGFADYIEEGEYKFTFAAEEMDMSLMAFRGAGRRVLPRAIKDIGLIEMNVTNVINELLNSTLRDVAIDGKHDFAPIMEALKKVKGAIESVHNPEAAAKVNHHLAAVAINYFKKDSIAKPVFGLLGLGRKNSLAAEYAGRGANVWEWDSREIDKFIVALETHELVPKKNYNMAKTPTYESIWLNLPILGPVKLTTKFKIPFTNTEVTLFDKRKPDFDVWSKQLRNDFGGNWRNIASDILTTYGPMAALILLFFFINKSYKEWFGGKEK